MLCPKGTGEPESAGQAAGLVRPAPYFFSKYVPSTGPVFLGLPGRWGCRVHFEGSLAGSCFVTTALLLYSSHRGRIEFLAPQRPAGPRDASKDQTVKLTLLNITRPDRHLAFPSLLPALVPGLCDTVRSHLSQASLSAGRQSEKWAPTHESQPSMVKGP